MPKQPMKPRFIRVPDELWAKALQRADERDETVSEAVRKFLERYVR
jgi:Arc/MetJ family transcription regulator